LDLPAPLETKSPEQYRAALATALQISGKRLRATPHQNLQAGAQQLDRVSASAL